MIYVGASWLLFWLLIEPLEIAVSTAAVVVGIVFILLGVLWGTGPVLPRR